MTTTTGPVSVFGEVRAVLGESLVWDPDESVLHLADIPAGLLLTVDAGGSVISTAHLPPPLASFQPRDGGGFVAALGDTVVVTDAAGVVEREIARVEHAAGGMRFNEGKCDPFGRFLVGSMDLSGTPDAALHQVGPNGDVAVLRGGFATTNGMEWSASGDTMYVTDTAVSTVFRGSYGPDGVLGELEPFIVGGAHDGLVRDDEGCFWSAIYGEGRVERYGPDGSHRETVTIPAPNVTSVAFGGADMSTLFVASARENMTEGELAATPSAGAVFAVPTSVRGTPAYRFAG